MSFKSPERPTLFARILFLGFDLENRECVRVDNFDKFFRISRMFLCIKSKFLQVQQKFLIFVINSSFDESVAVSRKIFQ